LTLIEKSFPKVNQVTNSNTNDRIEKVSGIGSINPLTLYQLVDSCVPSGGFAHSNTLEAAHQLHLLSCQQNSWRKSLRAHCFDVLFQTFTTTIPFLLEACNLFRSYYFNGKLVESVGSNRMLQPPPAEIMKQWEALDNELRATMNSHVACRASTTQGSGMLRAFSAAFPAICPVIKVLRRRIIRMTMPSSQINYSDSSGHAATCFGSVCGLLNIDNETCVSMFLYTTARDMVNAAVRMNLIGPLEGGCVTNELCGGINMLVQSHLEDVEKFQSNPIGLKMKRTDIAHQVAPLIEVLSNGHDRLYTRLFNS
jgi:urease accessory protein UreF